MERRPHHVDLLGFGLRLGLRLGDLQAGRLGLHLDAFLLGDRLVTHHLLGGAVSSGVGHLIGELEVGQVEVGDDDQRRVALQVNVELGLDPAEELVTVRVEVVGIVARHRLSHRLAHRRADVGVVDLPRGDVAVRIALDRVVFVGAVVARARRGRGR